MTRCHEIGTGSTWDSRVQAALEHLWTKPKDNASCESLCGEVDDIKYLSHASQPRREQQRMPSSIMYWTTIGVRSS